jgi:hypothetical protein
MVQTHWTERNAARQAYWAMPGMYRGKWEFHVFPYGPEPSDFDRYGQYFWFYGGWYIIWLSIVAAAVLVILDLILYVHTDPEREPDARCLALSVVPVSLDPRATNTSRMKDEFGSRMANLCASI